MRMRRRQRGWLGLVMMLLALVVVALLGRTVLREMGLLGGRAPVADDRRARPAAARRDTRGGRVAGDAGVLRAVDRARAVEGMVQQGAADRGRQIGDAEK